MSTQNKQPGVKAFTQEAPPVPQDYAATISVGSAVLAIIAFLLSVYTLWRNKRVEINSRFESAYGSPLRLALRGFEKSIAKLRAFVFPANKTIDELRQEIEPLRIELEEQSFEVANLLAEIDGSKLSKLSCWRSDFLGKTELAETGIQSLSHPALSSELSFRSKVDNVKATYGESISITRAKLDSIRAKV